MRIIKDWSEDEIKEFENYMSVYKSSHGDLSSMVVISSVVNITGSFPNLHDRYAVNDNNSKDNQFVQDIVDLVTGKAKFEDKKYYVKLMDEREGYLNIDTIHYDNCLGSTRHYSGIKTQFTMDEIKAIDERYVPFAVPVEEVGE